MTLYLVSLKEKKIDHQLFLDISLAIPIANGVSFISTSIVGTLIGEEKPKLRKFRDKRKTVKQYFFQEHY